MLDIYLKSTQDTDITQIGAFSAIGWVTVSYEINGKHAVPSLVNTQDHAGSLCLLARFKDAPDNASVNVTLTVQNDEVSRPSVSGSSDIDSSLTFSFAHGSQASDWQDANALIPVGA